MPQVRIISEYRPKIIVIELSPNNSPEEIVRINGIEAVLFSSDNAVITTLGDPFAIDTLSSNEKLFVRSWCVALIGGQKARPGDKLPWDAPGFIPPK
jgi:hypothetical protein